MPYLHANKTCYLRRASHSSYSIMLGNDYHTHAAKIFWKKLIYMFLYDAIPDYYKSSS